MNNCFALLVCATCHTTDLRENGFYTMLSYLLSYKYFQSTVIPNIWTEDIKWMLSEIRNWYQAHRINPLILWGVGRVSTNKAELFNERSCSACHFILLCPESSQVCLLLLTLLSFVVPPSRGLFFINDISARSMLFPSTTWHVAAGTTDKLALYHYTYLSL